MNITNESALDFNIVGNWAERSAMLKHAYPTLTDADLKFETGKENELVIRLAKRLNTKPEEITRIMNNSPIYRKIL